MAETRQCLGVVLAGGRSTRMGRDKALLEWHGRPLIDHQLALLQRAGAQQARVSGDRPAWQGIVDGLPDAGPLGGLLGVARVVRGETDLLVVPVDMPLLTAPLLARLLAARPEAACVRFSGHVLPMRWRLDATGRQQLEHLAQQADPRQRSLRRLQQLAACIEIDSDDGEAAQFTDCNTMSLWEKLHP